MIPFFQDNLWDGVLCYWPKKFNQLLLSFYKTFTAIYTFIFQYVSLLPRARIKWYIALGPRNRAVIICLLSRPLPPFIHLYDIVQLCLLSRPLSPFEPIDLNLSLFKDHLYMVPCVDPKKICPPHFHMYAIYGISIRDIIWGMYMHIFAISQVSNINQVTRRTVYILHKLHFQLLVYITEQKWLPLCKSRSCFPYSIWTYRCHIGAHYVSKHSQMQHLLCMLFTYICV